MKKTRFVVMLAVVMLFCMTAMATTASAIHIVDEEARIYVDGERVRNVDAYMDVDGDIRLYDVDELYDILPGLEEEVYVLPSDEGYVVVDYLEYVDYGYEQDGNRLYIYTDEIYSDDDVIDISDWEDDVIDISDLTEEKNAMVYVNGMYVATSDVYVSQDEGVYIVGFDDVYKIFPETKNMYLPFTNETTKMSEWASRYGYTLYQLREKVFLNNDGQTPVEVRVDGERINFPDQQPIIMDPGRTMIPVRSVAEVTEGNVTWDGENQRVIITRGSNKLILWLNNKTYWCNGYYYEMDIAPYVLNDRTMVPIVFIAQAFHCSVTTDWDGKDNNVFIVNLSSGW